MIWLYILLTSVTPRPRSNERSVGARVLLYLFYKLLLFLVLSYSTSSNKSLVGDNSQNISDDTSQSRQGDPSGPPKKDPKSNKSNKSYQIENSKNLTKSPVYLNTPVKVYHDACVSKFDIYSDFKDVSIIYMWFNKITGRIYIGCGVNGSKRLSTYFQPSILKK